jgi:hypothetical protein
MSAVTPQPSTDLGFDLSALEFWQQQGPAERDAAFATLRRERPVSWWGPVENLIDLPPEMQGGVYCALTRYADIRRV